MLAKGKVFSVLEQTPFPLPREVYITDELHGRPVPAANYQAEKEALQQLALSMVENPEAVLPQFVELAMGMTGGVSAGLSLFEHQSGAGVFRWHHVVGKLAAFEGATTPRNYSPCGVTLDAKSPVLARHSETLYTWISDAGIVVPEVLLVPLYIAGKEPLGTLWVVSDEEGYFNSNHARIAAELATFVGMALRMQQSDQKLRAALQEQEMLAREMNHRVKNVFAVADSLIRFSARGDRSKEEVITVISGRLRALASAHALVMRGFDSTSPAMSTLGDLVAAIVLPHNDDAGARISIAGAEVPCGEKAVSSLSLVLHELATNAAKYGALATHEGTLSVVWSWVGDDVELIWSERGGMPVATPPEREGFGSKLVQTNVERQLHGSVTYDWQATGLVVRIIVPLESLGS